MVITRKKLNWGTAQRKSDEKINENQRFRVRSPARVSFMKMKEIGSKILWIHFYYMEIIQKNSSDTNMYRFKNSIRNLENDVRKSRRRPTEID
jgi:hypothetical protein